VIMASGSGNGAGVKACADVATDKAKPATAINLIIILLLVTRPTTPTAQSNAAFGFRPRLLDFSAGVARRLDMDQGRVSTHAEWRRFLLARALGDCLLIRNAVVGAP
jgi:hypothetical protein